MDKPLVGLFVLYTKKDAAIIGRLHSVSFSICFIVIMHQLSHVFISNIITYVKWACL